MNGVKKMKRIHKLVLLWISVWMFSLSGCGGEAAPQEQESKAQEIVIWAWDDTFNIKAARMAAAEYQKENEDVQILIETKEREEILAQTQNILSAGLYENLPDIIMIEDYDVQQVLVLYEDEFVDLTDEIDYDKFADFKVKLCSRNGRMYGIPFDSGTAALFYRIDIIKKAGYTEADMQDLTWDEYMEIGRNVYAETGIPMLTLDPTDFPLVRLIMQSNGSWYVKQDGRTVDVQENEALKQQLSGNQELLNSIFSYNQNAKIINGQIVNRNINQWNNTATINVGSKDGAIVEGQAIVNNGYLIGFVSKVNESTSEIQLLTIENKQLNTPLMAVSGNQEINSILVGYDASKNEYSMKVLDQSKRLNVGDRVLTNGYQSGVAKGIRLGTISNLEVNNDTGEIIYKIKLPTSITDARYIGVVVNG